MKEILEAAARQSRFNLRRLLRDAGEAMARAACGPALESVRGRVTDAEYAHLTQGLVRATFLIELVNVEITSTKFEVRWAERLPSSDPRHATYDECLEAFCALVGELTETLGHPERERVWREFVEARVLPYELPIDYRERLIESPIHRRANLTWLWDSEEVRKAIDLRRALEDTALLGAESVVFAGALSAKIKVKTYLTDRVQTGAHQTDREKRWETHPGSVHFALRRECLAIERELLEQLCYFRGFPEDVRGRLVARGLLRQRSESCCPVTLKPLEYSEFVAALNDPEHGRSNFQVAHLRPLKANPGDGAHGHTAANIGWISADGNRIQGHYSLEDTRAMLRQIAQRYGSTGWEDPS